VTAARSVGLIEAWRIWLSGLPTDTLSLWGLEILWWGRVGKVLQFVGALSIIAEIVGVPRLRGFGRSLREVFPRSGIRKRASSSAKTASLSAQYFFAKSGSEKEARLLDELLSRLGDVLFWLMIGSSIVFIIATSYFAITRFGWGLGLIIAGVAIILFPFVVTPFIAATLMTVVAAVGWFADTIVIRPLSSLLEHPQLGQIAKVISVLLLAIGFHFDLLAS
jgi:hypothetical protein